MARKKKILLYEDFKSIMNVLVKSIQSKECDLILCDNLTYALEQLNGITMDLIICDSDCKENGAHVFMQNLRENTSYLFTPVILLVSGKKELHLKKYGSFNIAGYLTKPFDMKYFNQILDRFI